VRQTISFILERWILLQIFLVIVYRASLVLPAILGNCSQNMHWYHDQSFRSIHTSARLLEIGFEVCSIFEKDASIDRKFPNSDAEQATTKTIEYVYICLERSSVYRRRLVPFLIYFFQKKIGISVDCSLFSKWSWVNMSRIKATSWSNRP